MGFTPPPRPANPKAVTYLSTTQRWPPPAPDPAPARNDQNYLRIKIPVRVVSEANTREHWRERAQRTRSQQAITYFLLTQAMEPWTFPVPAKIMMTRYAPVRMDSDNLAGGFKHIQDAIAAWLGVDDGDYEYVTWEYNQTIIPRGGEYEVEIELWWQTQAKIPARPPRPVAGQLRKPQPKPPLRPPAPKAITKPGSASGAFPAKSKPTPKPPSLPAKSGASSPPSKPTVASKPKTTAPPSDGKGKAAPAKK